MRRPDQLDQAWEVEERKTKAPLSLAGRAKKSGYQREPESHRNRETEEATVGGVTHVRGHFGLSLA